MSEPPTLLKLLLRDRHWQNYGTFCTEYDKAASRVDPDLARSFPSRAQLHRWLTGSLRSLPYPDHCRVLEEMFPGWTAEQLFQRATPPAPGLRRANLLHLRWPARGYRRRPAAEALRRQRPMPDDIARSPDPIQVFAYAATISTDLAARVEAEMTDQELAAVATAAPTPYVHEVVTACRDSGRSVAVVSNNSARAVHAYLDRHGLDDRIGLVVARTDHDPALLKPSPHLIIRAVGAVDAEPSECALVGDSVTDIQAALSPASRASATPTNPASANASPRRAQTPSSSASPT